MSDVSANGTRLLEALPEEATQTALPRLILALLQTYEGPCPAPARRPVRAARDARRGAAELCRATDISELLGMHSTGQSTMGRCLASLADQTEVARMVDRAAALEFGDQVRALRAAAYHSSLILRQG